MKGLKWRYSVLERGKRQGISDAAVEGFSGNRIGSLAREICQNSLDAKDFKIDGPVIIHFKEFEIKREDFPDIIGLTTSFKNALLETKKLKDSKAYDTISKSLEVIESNRMKFLRISDFNTNGLDGVYSNGNSPWKNLTSAEGISDKDSSSGGSFGIGKNAAFATSELRTVLYSTINQSGEVATTGVVNLPSYDLDDSSFTQGPEFLGVDDKNRPLPELINLDKGFLRKEKGTDIYVAGFIDDNNEKNIVREILNNYLYAVFDDKLRIEVNSIVISKETLSDLLNAFEDEIEKETKELYQLLVSSEVLIYEKNILEEKDIEIRFILDKEGSNNVSMIRKPWMKVYNQGRFRKHYSFYGMCLIKGKKLNSLLRKSENPQHDRWEPDRVPQEKEKVKKTISDIKNAMSDILEELHEVSVPESLDVFGAGEYIPMDEDGNQKAQGKIKDKVINIEVKEIKKQIDDRFINEYEYENEGEYVIDENGEVELEVVHDPIKQQNKTNTQNHSVTIKARGVKINIEKRSIRCIGGAEKGLLTIIFKSNKCYKNANLRIVVLDEQGNAVNKVLKLISAKMNEKEFFVENDIIYNLELIEGYNKIIVQTNLMITVGIGVELYENKE